MAAESPPAFAAELIRWQKKHGRHNLPWQNTRAPYNIWIAETMLQQTQTTTVAPYYEKFLRRFPNIGVLARAREESVLALWRGLGYYARARHLHRAAKIIEREYGGIFPQKFADIVKLPGVGRSTAAAIAVFAFGRRLAILDGNVKRVLARYYAVSTAIDEASTITRLWQLSETAVPARADIRAYTQGLMDLGASLCTRRRPHCVQCPLHPLAPRIKAALRKVYRPANGVKSRLDDGRWPWCLPKTAVKFCYKSVPPPAYGADCGRCLSFHHLSLIQITQVICVNLFAAPPNYYWA